MSEQPRHPDLLTVAEFAAATRRSVQTVYRQLKAGNIPFVRIGSGDYSIHRSVLDELVRAAMPKAARLRHKQRFIPVDGDELAAYREGTGTDA